MSPARLWAALAVLLAYAALCAAIVLRERRRRRRERLEALQWEQDAPVPAAPEQGTDDRQPHGRAARAQVVAGPGAAAGSAQGDHVRGARPPLLILHASQTGESEAIARDTARVLHGAGLAVQVRPLGELRRERPRESGRRPIVASTYGEGDPPDSAAPFVDRELRTVGEQADLHGVQYGLLALGDRSYQHFCGFGRTLDDWLKGQRAQPMFERIDVDSGDPQALQAWRERLGELAGDAVSDDWRSAPAFEPWRLVQRTLLNAGSQGGPLYHLVFEPADGEHAPRWEAGDIAEVQVPADLERPRDYSIASLPDQRRLELLIRRTQRADGSPGLASGWLTGAPAGRQVVTQIGRAARTQPPIARTDARGDAHRDAHPGEHFGAHPGAQPGAHPEAHLEAHLEALPDADTGEHQDHLAVGDPVMLRIRTNSGFRLHANAGRPLILIGNGTGLAGLRAHLLARAAAGATPPACWLLFGERQAHCDGYFGDEIDRWLRDGVLARVDRVYSRDDPARRRHVQHALQEQAALLREWVLQGAAIYVCGSAQGMAPAVDRVLRDALGDARMRSLIEQGRYRRDVY